MYKKDHETDKCNYRPISLLSVSGKTMESAVASSIKSHISDNATTLVTHISGHTRKIIVLNI